MTDEPGGLGPAPTGLYAVCFPLLRAVIARMFRMRWIHHERVPMSGPVIMVSNHTSYIDPFAIGFSLPTRRPIHYMAKVELFRVPLLGWFLRNVDMFPVNRGTADRTAIRRASDILHAGGVVGIFPEGTRIRGDKKSEVEVGTAFIATLAGAPILPAGIDGTDHIWPPGRILPRFPRVTVAFGEPIDPAAFADLPKAQRLDAITAAVVESIRAAKAEAGTARRSAA